MLLADILALLHDGTTLLLPNARAARDLRSAFDAQQRALQRTTWKPASALSWQQWTTSLWSELIVSGLETRLLLNAAQEHALWVEVIADDPDHNSLASADSLATLARSAWQLAAAHNATPQLRTSATTHDSRIFSAWAEEFSQRCATRSYVSAAQLDHALHLHALSGNLSLTPELHLVGLADITPSQQLFLDSLSTTITHHTLTTNAPKHHLATIARTERDELLLAAQHILNLLREAPNARIAVLVPDLAADCAELESVLRSTLTPELQSIHADLSSTPWEFASGPPLASLPIVADALLLAHFAFNPLTLASISSLLLSPYLGESDLHNEAALFDANTLRQQTLLRPELDLTALLALDRNATLPWLRNLHTFLQREDLSKPRTYADWMQLLRGLSAAANWPGPRALNASDFAATVAFDGLLDLISTLDFSGRRVSFTAALEALARHAQTTPLTSPSTHATIQIMSPADAEGSLFDAVLFLRCTDANWPPASRPNPLLSWQLQRGLNMPGTDPALTTQHARDLTLGLLQRTPNVLFTSAAENSDGQLRPSPLLAELNLTELKHQDLVILSGAKDLLFQSGDEPVPYDLVPDPSTIPPLPQAEVHGGANLLKLQAACGFRAFAQLRLHSEELDTIDLGFDAPESGRRLHTALQLFWKQVKSQENLRALPTEVRDNILRDCIQRSLAQHLHPNGAWDSSFLAMQQQRLFTLLSAWLDTELQRGPFTVLDSEQKQQIPIGPLTLDVRLDRIDSVTTSTGDGFVLVDYKTGLSGHPSEWHDEDGRPDEPQLPLYTLLDADEQLKGLAFAKVVAGEMKWLGYQAEDGILPPSRVNQVVNLTDVVAEWRSTLERLAYDFASGHAAVEPKDYPTTCARCPQRILCRLDPATLHTREESEVFDG
jgi:probable DNA repair protein